MSSSPFTRYFLFTRTNPRVSDYELVVRVANKIDAHLGYATVYNGGTRVLKGFIVLRGPRTFVGTLCKHFPNFLLFAVDAMETYFDFNLDSVPDGVTMVNEHPFQEVRKTLFKDKNSLAEFFKSH